MTKNLTEIICVVDKSGSMETKKTDAIGGFNRFLEDQKKVAGEARFTLTLFDDVYKIVHDGVDIQKIQPLTDQTYVPGGCTALLDAVGRTIDKVGERLGNTPEKDRPERVVMVILTDGMENASREYTREQVLQRVKHQQEAYSWAFVFLGADLTSVAEANAMGIHTTSVGTGSSVGVRCCYANTSKSVSHYRSGGKIEDVWQPDPAQDSTADPKATPLAWQKTP